MAPQFGLKLETLALALQTTALLWLWWRQSHRQSTDDSNPSQQQRINLENDASKKEKARVDERRGRVAAEKHLARHAERVGIFCTRSPHRPNPIGITLAKIERVDMRNRTVFLSGVDLLHETPVLDVKPYISAAIEEVLKVDVRSKYQTRRWTSPDYVNYQVVDNARVQYRFALVPPPPSCSDGSSDIDTARIQILDVEEVNREEQDTEKKLAEMPPPPPAAKRNRSRVAKPKKKKKVKEKANCVGFFVDALDKKMLWSEAKIIACNLATQKIRVHFVGWGKSYDLWTDPMSITSHGRYAPRSIKAPNPKSWGGDMHLFEDMLGPIEGATFTSVQAPASTNTASSIPTNGKLTEKKKSVRTKAASARAPPKAAVKGKVVANGTVIVKKPTAKRAAPAVKAKLKPEQPPAKKRQKLATPETATAASRPATKTRAVTKKKSVAPPDLPMFRQLELDDGTLVDFAAQREEAREEREGTQSFLARCALIWKQQVKTLSV
ncbi:hypothetical protein BBJ28_00002621 [Nothophytophthora sp. Chile5]|nr:hypothetical protein BBJ28_00002621 [Nothophytophthora sp. Chile5]